ncbi:hypothetical protein P3X46_009198 [Hevea brasiliensis]|uniref:Uncharacterized protein n=1 Tax=Hevea brasiliensis TaxID=3981 RepID=A0ABQ9ML41_HEVBR|nr:UPF0481 protein At3g47200 [Hevea brasiliensis]KAJ9181022.1 hypothetical protein P3X46_009198 [Hevea brasiliensis]
MSSDAIEVQATKVVKREADQASGSHDQINVEDEASGSHDQPIEENQKLSIVIHGKPTTSKILQERLDSLNEAAQKPEKSRIQKVPFMLREDEEFKKHYEPRVVAIGPIHHGCPNFDYAETIKHRLAGHFMEEQGIDAKDLYKKIMEKLDKLKLCYVEDVIKCYSDDELAWMFLVDGCAMLNFIHRVVKDDEKVKKLNIKKDQVAFAQQDLFLLENQLPFELLELLRNSVVQNAEKEEIGKSINKFIGESLMTTEPSSVTKEYGKEPSPSHLLELLREELINRSANITAKNIKPENRNREPHSFRNVKELIASGIRLKPTGERSLTISFERSCFAGTLKLPSLLVDDSTAPKLKNLIALEMCPDFLKDFEVTSYICFLDSLIDHPEDVQELRKAKILTNVLGSDKEVAKLFNKIGTDLVPNPDLYANVKADIEKHYKSRWKTYTAEAYHTYFSSPWTFLALLGALLALLFSAVQAYFSLPSEKC